MFGKMLFGLVKAKVKEEAVKVAEEKLGDRLDKVEAIANTVGSVKVQAEATAQKTEELTQIATQLQTEIDRFKNSGT